MPKTLPPMHPGEVLREEYLEPLNLPPRKLAQARGIPRTRIQRLANERFGITADTALRLGKALRTSAQFWLNLQNDYDLRMTREAIAEDLKKVTSVQDAA